MTSSLSSRPGTKTLLLEGVNDSAVELFTSSGYTNLERLPKALDADALRKAIPPIELLGIRSRTQLTRDLFAAPALSMLPLAIIRRP